MEVPPFPYKLIIPILYSIALLIPFTCQFFIPATPIFAWVLSFYSNRFIPSPYRPSVHVALLPTLESVLYGANVSDILTRFTHPLLDIIAWIPYGVLHYTLPFVVAFFIWLFRYPLVLRTWAKTFGYMNLIGVLTQIILPCAAPWYELIYGLTPASYATPGSAGGLARIDAIFHSNGYQATFASSPLVFGAFPSLHAAWATLEALFLSHYFPHMSKVVWIYAGVLYWSTMYLTHHYLIDVVGGACLAVAAFYGFFPEELRDKRAAVARPFRVGRSKYEVYDLEERRGIVEEFEEEFASEESTRSEDGEEDGITFRSPNVGKQLDEPRHSGEYTQPNGHSQVNGYARTNGSHQPKANGRAGGGRSHRHTASIVSLIRADERIENGEEGWSPIGSAGFVFPPVRDEGRR